ncbi:MAG: MFS transporter [Acidobacteria bacterium]|nr:MFS transporter [Acidobacteriota bacterium]
MHGLYLLWWVGERGISPAIVAAILVAGDLAFIGLEIPAGWFADRFGHRASLIIGSLVQVIGMLACWLGRGVPELVLAAVLVALGDAFRSGADEALLYRTCVALGREEDFQKIEAQTKAAGLFALVALLIAGGVIVSHVGFAAAWAAEATLCAFGLAMACCMIEPPVDSRSDGTTHESGDQSEGSSASALLRGRLAILILPVALIDALAASSSFLVQTEGILSPDALTLAVAAMTLAEAAGAFVAARSSGCGSRGLWLLASGGVVTFAAALVLTSGILLAAVVSSFILGLMHPLRATLLQREAVDSARARVASMASACDVAFASIAVSLAGGWRHGRRS